jgi:hypothetical protein
MLPMASIEWTAEPNGIRFQATISTRNRAEIFVRDSQVIPAGPARSRRSPLWARETPPCHSALPASDTTGDRAALRGARLVVRWVDRHRWARRDVVPGGGRRRWRARHHRSGPHDRRRRPADPRRSYFLEANPRDHCRGSVSGLAGRALDHRRRTARAVGERSDGKRARGVDHGVTRAPGSAYAALFPRPVVTTDATHNTGAVTGCGCSAAYRRRPRARLTTTPVW